MIFHSPLLPESQIEADNVYGLTKEFFLYVAIFLGMLAYCFKEKSDCKCAKKEEIEENEEEIIQNNKHDNHDHQKNRKNKKKKKAKRD